MGYILLSPEYIESKEGENWHLFKAKKVKGKPDLRQQMEELAYGVKEYIVEIIDDDCLPECKEKASECKEEAKVIKCISKYIDINSKYYKSIPIEYNLKKETTRYNPIEKLEYFTNENQTLFYSNDEDTIRMLACLLGRCICGSCMSKLYGDNKNKNK